MLLVFVIGGAGGGFGFGGGGFRRFPGRADTSVPPEHQDELAACFLDPTTGGPPAVYRHPKAHAIQLPKPTLRAIVEAIDAMATVALSNTATLARMAPLKKAGIDPA